MSTVRSGSALAVLLVAALARGADLAPPVAPALPGAVADANATIAIVAQDGGSVAAVDLATGQTRWRSARGRWPLASAYPWVAVAGPDDADRRLLHVRFLRPADGGLLVDAKPIRLPAVIAAEARWEGEGLSLGTGNDSLQLSAWIPRPPRGRSRDPHAGHLRIRWKTQSFIGGGGMRPPERGPSSSGLVFVDPASGAVDAGPDDPAQVVEPRPPALPPSWQRAPDTVPQLSMDGRHVIVSRGNAGVETFTFYDLSRAGKDGAAIQLPHLEPRFRSPFSVVGPSLYYLAEGEGRGAPGGATAFPRWLVCVDWARGKIRWTHPLPARVLPPPMAGAGPGFPH